MPVYSGYHYEGLQPILVVQSGDTLDWELPTMAAQCECSLYSGSVVIYGPYIPIHPNLYCIQLYLDKRDTK